MVWSLKRSVREADEFCIFDMCSGDRDNEEKYEVR